MKKVDTRASSLLLELLDLSKNNDRERRDFWTKRLPSEVLDTELPEYNDATAELLAHLAINPHLLIPCGFDEIRIDPKAAEESLSFTSKAFAERSQAGFSPSEKGFFAFCAGIRCRATASGVWYSYGGLRRQVLRLRSQYAGEVEFLLREIIAACRKAISEPVNLAVLTLPNLWRPVPLFVPCRPIK